MNVRECLWYNGSEVLVCNLKNALERWGIRVRTSVEIAVAVVGVLLVVIVLLQPGSTSGAGGLSGLVSGGMEQSAAKAKARGFDALLHRMTIVLSTLFMVLVITLAFLLR